MQGDINPKYEKTFVFINDYSAVKEEQAEYKPDVDPKGQPIHLALQN
jgi:UDPglucose--hexose-1-phosphate uridylyltransferase